jgi:bifunctional non-homologous end joining protein LigD
LARLGSGPGTDYRGIPRFQLLQQWQKRPTAPVVYYLFDLLWSNGRDLAGKTVLPRRDRLEQIITPISGIQVGGYVEARGKDLFALAKEKGLEGIIAKRKASIYRPGKRSPDWLKIKSRPQQEFVVCGFTEGKGSRQYFGALLLAAYRNGTLRYFPDRLQHLVRTSERYGYWLATPEENAAAGISLF